MIKRKTYFMLFISFFTFFGLSEIQNLSHFTQLFHGKVIEVDFAGEEENEGANKEVKEIVLSILQKKDLAVQQCNQLIFTALHRCSLRIGLDFSEIITPPPER